MQIIGTEIPAEFFPQLEPVRVLEEFEGPLLVEYRDAQSGETYVYSWVSCMEDGSVTRWMVWRVRPRALASYLKKVSSFLSLLQAAPTGVVYLRDIDKSGTTVATSMVRVDKLPERYLPAPHIMHDAEDEPEDFDSDQPWTVLIDGEWSIEELGSIPRLYKNVYNGLYAFGRGLDVDWLDTSQLAIIAGINDAPDLEYDVRKGRGFAVIQLFEAIEGLVPHDSRARLDRIQLSSPGELTMHLERDVARCVRDSVDSYRPRGAEIYEQLWDERHPRSKHRLRSDDYTLDRLGEALCDALLLDWSKVVASFKAASTRADFVLAFARRIQELIDLIDEKKIEAL